MGQIIGSAAKPKRCNLSKLSQLGTPAAGEHILVSSDNSMNAAGQGNFDAYIVGNGQTAATALPLHYLYPLYNTTGDAVDGAMTQQAVTRELTELTGKVDEHDVTIYGRVSLEFEMEDGGLYPYSSITPSSNSSSAHTRYPIDISGYVGKTILIQLARNSSANSSRYNHVTDANNNILLTFCEKSDTVDDFELNPNTGYYEYSFVVTSNMKYLYISYSTDFVSAMFVNACDGGLVDKVNAISAPIVLYVSTNGSDSNDGSESSPLATVNAALDAHATKVFISEGEYKQTIDLSKAKGNVLEISAADNATRVIFSSADNIIATSASIDSTYTNVKYIPYTSTPNRWIFQKGIADVSTIINDRDRHPLERGCHYRCEDTKISAASSDNLEDALTEINTSSNYLYYYDSSNSVLYFSSPSNVTSDNPIVKGGGNLFTASNPKLTLKMTRIETEGLIVNLSNMKSPELIECKSRNAYGYGCFFMSHCENVKFVRCEASCAHAAGEGGDGFNGHADTIATDYLSRGNSCTLIDCWAHDCYDDGYSSHAQCESTIIGGLFENNGKGGITPADGEHCTCYSVYARNNKNGFYYTIASGDGGAGGQMICYNCVAESNTAGSNVLNAGFYVLSEGNSAILVNCKSIANRRGYYCGEGTFMTLIDCGVLGNTVADKTGSGTFVIKNTTVIS